MTTNVNLRELGLSILMEVMENGSYSHLVMGDVLDKYQYLEKKERAFLTRLSEGTLERIIELDYIINQFSKVKTDKMKPLIRNLLRMSVYQLRYMDSVPDAAVCNEAVKLAKKKGFGPLSGFVNGVLRSIARNREQISYPREEEDRELFLSIVYSIPRWVVSLWCSQFGYDKTRSILENLTKEQGLVVRCNLEKATPAQLAEELEGEQIQVRILERPPYALELKGVDSIERLPAFSQGKFYVQDVSSMMVAETATPKAGDIVIDVCAAPGGKSLHLAEMLKGTGLVEARDLTEYKTALLRENVERHGLKNVKVSQWDATVADEESVEKADILICDLPCSGLGVMGKKTDIRYKMTPEKMSDLVQLQRRILDTVWRYVKPGGTLLYSTCTIHEAENQENVAWFLEKHPEFQKVSMEQLLPGEVGQDGFFIAKMKRNG